MSWESWIDRLVRQGREQGEFDNLPGWGKPIADLDRHRDEDWWVKEKLRREEVSFLPPTLQLRKDVEDALQGVAVAASEAAVREIVRHINVRIRKVNSRATAGPPSTLMPLDEERVVEKWRAQQSR